MRNIFDQYSHPENRLTHALVTSLSEDPKLLNNFVRWVTGKRPPNKNLKIIEQRLPGEPEITEDESERRGLPDAWIHDNDRWSLLIESKVSATLNNDQLRRHYNTAIRRGFDAITVLAIDVIEPRRKLIDEAIFKSWTEIYDWLYRQSNRSEWSAKTLRYMEIAEAKWIANGYLQEGTLTKFSGIPFNSENPYNYPEAKRLIKLMMEELRNRNDLKRQLDIDTVAPGRGMITGKQRSSVWDFLRLKAFKHEKDFIRMIHLTLSMQSDKLFVLVTVPNGLSSQYRKRLTANGLEEFEDVFKRVHKNLKRKIGKVEGAMSWMEVLQRHYRTQTSPPTIDARLAFTLDTAFETDGRVKQQPLWLESTYNALVKKRGNTQLGVGAIFPYATCPATQTPKILDHIASTWIACKPLITCIKGK